MPEPAPRWRRLRSGVLAILLMRPLGPAGAQPTSIDDLLAKAAREEAVRVLVELRVDGPSPANGEAIERAQDVVLHELTATEHRVRRRFTTVPFIALEATPDALRRLAASPHVAGLHEDRILRPQGSPATP